MLFPCLFASLATAICSYWQLNKRFWCSSFKNDCTSKWSYQSYLVGNKRNTILHLHSVLSHHKSSLAMHNQFLFQNKPFLLAVNVYAWYTAHWLTTNTREGLENKNRMTHIYSNIATYNDYVWTHETGFQNVLSFILTVDSVSSITSYTVLAKAYIYTKVLCYIKVNVGHSIVVFKPFSCVCS